MALNELNKYEIRHRALLEVVRICGGVTAYSKSINVSRSRASNWVNRSEIVIPYEYLVMTEDLTNVNIERLSPETKAANKVIRKWRSHVKQTPAILNLSDIVIGSHPYLNHFNEQHKVLVGTDGVLISGLMQINHQKSQNIKKIKAFVLDLETLILEENQTIKLLNLNLLTSEKIAVGLRLEQLLGNKQGQRFDLTDKKNNLYKQLRRPGDEVGKTRGERISEIVGFSSKDIYYRARKIYLSGDSELIDLVDQKKIQITVAARKMLQQSRASQCNLTQSIGAC